MSMMHATEVEPVAKPATAAGVTELSVTGMTCNNCARHVTEALQEVPGVRSAAVNLPANRASVRWNAGTAADVGALQKAVADAGYEARPVAPAAAESSETRMGTWQLTLWVGVLGTVPLMIGEWVLRLGGERWFQWASFALAAAVQVFAGAQFYRGAWSQLKVGRSNMDTLVALGSTTAFAYSVWALIAGVRGHLYFMEAASIITLISLGHWVESRVSVRASSALKELLNLAPSRALRRNADGSDAEVAVAELQPGDLVVLRPGDQVPTDGEVTEGESALDESMLTGESAPVDKTPGRNLYAGTANISGRLIMRVQATGEETALAHIIAAVQRAQTSRAGIQRLGDQVSNVFVPVVVTIALAAGLWWGLAPASAMRFHDLLERFLWTAHPPAAGAAGFIIAAAVLIIACPCAMGLATPAAIMAGSNAAARRGILIRDGVALEKAGEVTAILFDKTGTLTSGKPQLVKAWAAGSGEPRENSRNAEIASALASNSAHPISQAIAAAAKSSLQVRDWQEIRGFGVQGTADVDGAASKVRLGSVAWLRSTEVDTAAGDAFVAEWTGQGATVVGLTVGNSLRALFAVKDTLKPGAPSVIAQLAKRGLGTYLVTGDNQRTAAAIASQLRIPAENVFAEVRPEQKAEFVRKLQGEGKRVAFVGDGINDAPALEQADLGVAVSRASDVAREAADIILLKSEIEAVPEALGLAQATLRTIKQNLFWAFFYNAIGVPLAALGFMSPILCAAAMGFSDLIVIGNALRLRRWRLRE
jgi:Cu+-exporting ATPase